MQLGEWGTMIESDLPFNRHTAHKLMQIAADKRLTAVGTNAAAKKGLRHVPLAALC
jgi:hypothetical protein